MKYTVHQINLTDDEVGEIRRVGGATGEYPDFYQRYINTTMVNAPEDVYAAWVYAAWHADDYTPACHIEADSLDDVFEIGNIGPEKRIERLGVMHSVSVGDVVEDETGKYHCVTPIGFKAIERGLS